VTEEPDDWGFDAGYVRALRPLTDLLYERWWRVEASALEHVPARGRALLVANHDGALPYDALMLATAIRHGPRPRDARFLVSGEAFELPYVSPALRRLGGVPAAQQNARALLEQGHLVIAFCDRGDRRYSVGRLGRGELVATALRTQTPIVPCAVVGSAEVHPLVAGLPLLGRRLAVPLFGPLPLPSKWLIAFGEPIVLGHPPEAAEDRALVLSLSDRVRETIQQSVHETLIRRKAAFV
jgi:1-acyl-sn-glycerol-3-phosphate acyltransferase